MKRTSPLPFEIQIPEYELLENGTMFVFLMTPVALLNFWGKYKDQFSFACCYSGMCDPFFLRPGEWVFGSSKAAVVETALRWKELRIGVEFYDCASNDPGLMDELFTHREQLRKDDIAKGLWSAQDEAKYVEDCIRRTPETYRGWWQLKNLPDEREPDEWFASSEEIIDPNLPISDVTRMLQEQIFDDWSDSGVESVSFYNKDEITEYVFDFGSEYLATSPLYVEGTASKHTLKPLSMEVTYGSPVNLNDEQKSQDSMITASPYTSLMVAAENIVGELVTILDEDIQIGSALAETIDAHNLTPLHAALDDALLAINRIFEMGGVGASVALKAFKAFEKTVRQPTVEELRNACKELDPQEYMDDYVLGALSEFEKHVDAEDDFDTTARIHKAFPPQKAD